MANAGQSRTTSILLWVLGVAVIVGLVYAVRALTHEQVQVEVVPVTFQNMTTTVATNGNIEPLEEFQAHAPYAGAVKRIYVKVGQPVSKGTLLVHMDDAEVQSRLAIAKAGLNSDLLTQRDIKNGGTVEDLHRFETDIKAAQMEQQNAAKELATRQRLLEQGSDSQAEVADAQRRLDNANFVLHNAEQRRQTRYNQEDLRNVQARAAGSQASIASADNAIANVDVRSPINGTVYNIPVTQFDWVQFGEDILDVADLKHLQVRAYFDEPEIGRLAAGQPVRIIWDAKRDKVWHGHVSLAPTTINSRGNRNVGVCLISVDDPTPDLIPNTNVTVTVTEMERPHVLSIPREALHTDGPRNFVYRIVDGHLAATTVQVGMLNLTSVEIVGGLHEGDRIVRGAKSSLTELTDGLEVKQVQ